MLIKHNTEAELTNNNSGEFLIKRIRESWHLHFRCELSRDEAERRMSGKLHACHNSYNTKGDWNISRCETKCANSHYDN